MSDALDGLKATLSGLPANDRAALAEYLLRTLDGGEEDARPEWLAVAERRLAEVQTGMVVGIPAEQVLERLRRTKA